MCQLHAAFGLGDYRTPVASARRITPIVAVIGLIIRTGL